MTATETSTSLTREAATNESGIFVFPDLPIGTYALKISATGFETQNRPGLTLITGQVIDLPIAMAVGSQTQQITVTSETQQIETSYLDGGTVGHPAADARSCRSTAAIRCN